MKRILIAMFAVLTLSACNINFSEEFKDAMPEVLKPSPKPTQEESLYQDRFDKRARDLSIVTDRLTGCKYLIFDSASRQAGSWAGQSGTAPLMLPGSWAGQGGITPLMLPDGTQDCSQITQTEDSDNRDETNE